MQDEDNLYALVGLCRRYLSIANKCTTRDTENKYRYMITTTDLQ